MSKCRTHFGIYFVSFVLLFISSENVLASNGAARTNGAVEQLVAAEVGVNWELIEIAEKHPMAGMLPLDFYLERITIEKSVNLTGAAQSETIAIDANLPHFMHVGVVVESNPWETTADIEVYEDDFTTSLTTQRPRLRFRFFFERESGNLSASVPFTIEAVVDQKVGEKWYTRTIGIYTPQMVVDQASVASHPTQFTIGPFDQPCMACEEGNCCTH